MTPWMILIILKFILLTILYLTEDVKGEDLVKEEQSKDTKEETLVKEEEVKETKDEEKNLVKEKEPEVANVATTTS